MSFESLKERLTAGCSSNLQIQYKLFSSLKSHLTVTNLRLFLNPGHCDLLCCTLQIDMLRIQQKLKMDEYTDLEELKSDFEKLFNNALAYYKKGTQEYRDASEMSDLFQKASGEIHIVTIRQPLLDHFLKLN